MTMLSEIDQRLQYGPGMRAQRLAEAAFLIAAFFSGDVRFAYVTLASMILQTISGRLAPVALVVAALVSPSRKHRLGNLYFDLSATRAACAVSALVSSGGIALVNHGHATLGYMMLALPTASLVLSPTVGFCCGCAVYVLARDLFVRLGLTKRYANGACDVDIGNSEASSHQ
jgi:hypothetical protein